MSDSPLPNEGGENAPADAEVTTPAAPPEPAAAADPAPAVDPETDADPAPDTDPAPESAPAPEAPPSNPNITCKRCGTVTNWNPYCPTCGAYLEFMGVPSWSPTEVTSTVPEPKPPAPEPTEPAEVVEPAETQTPEEPVEAVPLPADEPHHHFHGLHFGHHEDDAVDDGPVDTKPIPWWAFWRHPKAPKKADPNETTPSTELSEAATGDDGLSPAAALVATEGPTVNVIPAHPTVDVVAELPQEEQERQERTRRSILSEGETRGPAVDCPHCGHQNPIDHAYCEWCGSYLSTYRLAPVPPVIKETTGAGKSGDSTSSPIRQAWRKSYLLYVILALIVFLIWFFFWGPMATTTRAFFEEVGQTISEFIFPKLGEETSVSSIVSSSSLPGTTPTSLNQASSVDYWASAEMNGLGVGTTITFTFTQCYPIDRIIVAPGTQDSDLDVQALAQPKNISMTFSPSGTIGTVLLEAPTSNELYTQIMSFPTTYATSVTVAIDSVYPSRYVITPDPNFGAVAISSLNFLQSPSINTVSVLNPFRPGGESSSASAAPSSAASAAPSSAASGASAPAGTSSPSGSATATPSASAIPCAAPGTTPSPSPTPSASSSASPTTTGSPSPTPTPSTASPTPTKTPKS
ncbi:MAG: zinc ribbon domain-containing protein [Actinobacteria bacterium]|nr:zinc ribbon domain-containing protein [Actinomycetota bacterium]